MWTVRDFIKILEKHDQDSFVAIQWGYSNGFVKSVSTLSINQDKRYNSLQIKKEWKGNTPVTFLTIWDKGVIEDDGSLRS